MKTTILSIAGGICAIAAFVYYTNSAPQTTTAVAVAVDKTEPLKVQPIAWELLRLYNLNTNPYSGATFRLTAITDLRYNPAIAYSLKPVEPLNSNQIERNASVKAFKENVSAAISTSAQAPIGRQRSSVYITIARELKLLKQQTADKRIFIVYSDLMEHAVINFYDPKTLALLKSNPKEIRRQLEQQESLPDLKGIEVHIVFQPKDYEADSTFDAVSRFYLNWLYSKGAAVSIQSNLVL